MKFITTGDWHLKYDNNSRMDNYWETILEKLHFIFNYAYQNKINRIVVCGDIFDKTVVTNFELMFEDLKQLFYSHPEIITHFIIGNHDSHSSDSSLKHTTLDVMQTCFPKNFVYQKFDHFIKNTMAYDYTKRSDLFKYTGPATIAFTHDAIQGPYNYDMSKYTETVGCSLPFKLVFTGHYHYKQDFVVGNTRYINPGCIMRLTNSKLDKAHNPQFCVVDDTDFSVDFIPLPHKSVSDVFKTEFVNKISTDFLKKLSSITNCNVNDKESILKILENKVSKEVYEFISSML